MYLYAAINIYRDKFIAYFLAITFILTNLTQIISIVAFLYQLAFVVLMKPFWDDRMRYVKSEDASIWSHSSLLP